MLVTGKRYFRVSIKIALIVLVSLILLLFLLSIFAPGIMESYIRSQAARLGLSVNAGRVRTLGFTKFDAQDITLGQREQPDLVIDFFSSDYSPLKVLKGRLKNLRILGLELNLDDGPHGLRLRGLEPLFAGGSGGQTIHFDKLEILAGVINLNRDQRRLRIPFGARLVRQGGAGPYQVFMELIPFGEPLILKGQLDLDSGSGQVDIHSQALRLQDVNDHFNLLPGIFFQKGINLRARVSIMNWGFRGAEVKLISKDLGIVYQDLHLNTRLDVDLGFKLSPDFALQEILLSGELNDLSLRGFGVASPLKLRVHGQDLHSLEYTFSPIKIDQPLPFEINTLKGTISRSGANTLIKGDYSCPVNPGIISTFMPAVQVSGSYLIKGRFEAVLPETRLSSGFAFESRNAKLKIADLLLEVARLDLPGKIDYDSRGDLRVQGELKIRSAAFKGPNQTSLEDINLDLPWTWIPREKRVKRGTFSAASLRIADLGLNQITGSLSQQAGKIAFAGTAKSLLEELKFKFSGKQDFGEQGFDFRVDFEIPASRLARNTPLDKLHPILTGVLASGQVYYSGSIRVAGANTRSQALVRLKDVDIQVPASNLSIIGLEGEIRFKNLIALQGEPAQILRFKELRLGQFQAAAGKLIFTVEGPDTIFLEKGEFGWLRGKVMVNSLRFKPADTDLDLSLYCDRIDFDELLNLVVGRKVASGDAEINGLLPLRISQGYPHFEEGYLYSTPGIEGHLRIEDSRVISAGMALVEESMKDFLYDWVKVKLIPKEKNVDIVAIIKGMPSQKLPLSYDGKKKDFVSSKSGVRRVELKGLVLELRFMDIDLKSLLKGGNKLLFINKKK